MLARDKPPKGKGRLATKADGKVNGNKKVLRDSQSYPVAFGQAVALTFLEAAKLANPNVVFGPFVCAEEASEGLACISKCVEEKASQEEACGLLRLAAFEALDLSFAVTYGVGLASSQKRNPSTHARTLVHVHLHAHIRTPRACICEVIVQIPTENRASKVAAVYLSLMNEYL